MMYRVRYKDKAKQYVYENACDCLYYGFGFETLNKLDLSEEDSKAIWNQATLDLERM